MNTTVIIIMIISTTIIALVAIICDHLFEKKSSETSECLLSKKIIKIHRNYIAGFLGFAIIMLMTAQYGGPGNAIFAYLSFGSTITSLVLSILAIFVTVQSSSDLYKQFTRIDNATDTINNISNQIDGTLGTLKAVETDLQETSKEISNQLEYIVEQIDERLQKRMKETEGNISRQLDAAMNKSSENETQQTVQSTTEGLENFKTGFKNLTSASGLLGLYACVLSFEKSKMFEMSNLFKGNEAYTFGFLISAFSSGIIIFNNDSTNNQITCTGSIFTSTELYEVIKERVKQFGIDYLNKINEINAFFGIAPLIMDIK